MWSMRDATIIVARRFGGGTPYAKAIGAELRARRLHARLTQRQLALPHTGAYVSSVETGRVMPSLPALLLMLERLELSAPVYFEAVNCRLRVGTLSE